MNNFLEELKQYFEETPRSKVLEDWAKTAEYDNVGPTVEEFLSYSPNNYIPNLLSESCQQSILNNLSSKFSSGFLFTPNINLSKCKKPHFQL